MNMLTKQIKAIKGLHRDFFLAERRIVREIGKLQKKARADFKRMLRMKRKHAAVRFSSLHDEAFTKEWDAIIYVERLNGSMTKEEFASFCQLASEKIGATFVPIGENSEI